MAFKEISLPPVLSATKLPDDLTLRAPEHSTLPIDQQHYLLYIPWEDSYLQLVPGEYQTFFKTVLPYLFPRTTDVHTAISLSYLDELVNAFPANTINKRVVALALILHDSGWSKLTEEEVANSLGVTGLKLTETAMGPKEKHAVEGEKIARQLLADVLFDPPLSSEEVELICKAVLYHDKPEAVAGAAQPMPIEVQVLVDLDHLWSFTHQNFWQDTVRKGVAPRAYLENLAKDLDGYFVTDQGKALARKLHAQRALEVTDWEKA